MVNTDNKSTGTPSFTQESFTSGIGTSKSFTIPGYESNCQHRLPCGICELTNKKCPLCWTSNEPYVTWTTYDINTCNGKGE